MSASGSTPHLHLSQYSDTDHPSYVGDYTEDMSRIDTGFNLAQSNALAALNRVAALEQSIGSAGAVGQTALFQVETTVDGSVSDENQLLLGFGVPSSTTTRNAEPAEVPWTWESTNGTVRLVFAASGVYRVTVEANVSYQSSLIVSSALIGLQGGDHDIIVPLGRYDDPVEGRCYSASGSFVIPCYYDRYGPLLAFVTSFNGPTVSGAQIRCDLSVDVEQLSSEKPRPQSSQNRR